MPKPKKIIIRCISFILGIIVLLIILDIFIDYDDHQLTYAEAFKYSMPCYEPSDENVYTLRKNYDCYMTNATDFSTTARINSLGYRGKEFTVEKPAGTKRILFLGGSFTFGYGVDDKNTYPYKVESLLRESGKSNTEVINAGFADGFSPDSFYLYLKNHGLALKPDMIVESVFVWSNISDLSTTIWDQTDKDGLPEKIQFCCSMIDGHRYRVKSIEFKYRYPFLRDSQLFLLAVNSLKNANPNLPIFATPPSVTTPESSKSRSDIFNPNSQTYDVEFEKTFKVIKATKDLADAQKIPFVVILLPVDAQIFPEQIYRYGYDQFPGDVDYLQKRIGAGLNERGIQYFDLLSTFTSQKEDGPSSFAGDQHWNAHGTDIAAKAISEYLLKNYSL